MTNTNQFLPIGYEPPIDNKHYMKLIKGENKIRILSRPIVGWLDWLNNKPVRTPMSEAKPQPFNPAKPVRHFWAFVVWNYNDSAVQIMEITQVTIQQAILRYSNDSDWGAPFDYDLKITKKVEAETTAYAVVPVPKKEVAKEIKDTYDAMAIDLNALFTNEDPFRFNK